MDEFEGLNDQQRRAVEHINGPLLVVAGAGTGKTQVITRRIAHLIQTGQAKPGQILALTFTDKASNEMSDRLFSLIGWESFSVPVMTFNAFGSDLLTRYGNLVKRSTRGGLINDTQKMLILRQRLDDIKLEYYGLHGDTIEFLERVVSYIGRLQNAGVTSTKYSEFVDGLDNEPGTRQVADIAEQRDLASLYELYDRLKAETNTFDYYDQLAIPLRILQERPNIAQRLSETYRFVLVDEYQDTSPVQDALLRQFVPKDGNIFAVGDDDQAIYGFRGADIDNIMRFTDHFNVAKPLALIQNYRSGQPILDAAYRLIRHNDPERLEAKLGLNKQLKAQTTEARVSFTPYRTVTDEQSGVIALLAQRLDDKEAPGDIAVLARSNAMLRSYAKELRRREIPFAISTTINIFEQRELINLWYLMKWVGLQASDEAISHVLMGPFLNLNAAEVRVVVQRSKHDLVTMEEALRLLSAEGEVKSTEVIAQLDRWREWASTTPISQLGYRLVFETGLAERLQLRPSEDMLTVKRIFDDLNHLLSHMQDYESSEIDTSLIGYLATFPKPPEIEVAETIGDPDGVQLLTVHAAKGLEFKTVYIVNCTARSWSSQGNSSGLVVPIELTQVSELPPVHEQRRLMYVAVTRAKHELVLSAPAETLGGQRQAVSPLVQELFDDELPQLERLPKRDETEQSLQKLQRFFPLQAEMPTRLPFERADGWIEIGVGDLERYERSPHDFYLQKVLGISQPFGPQLAFGKAVHGAIQTFYEGVLRGETPPLAELERRLDEDWSDRGYDSRAQAETARAKASDTIKRFREREIRRPSRINMTELPIKLEITEAKLRLSGRIDATIMTPEGLEVRDFKTGNISDPVMLIETARDSFQLRTYALAIEQLTGTAPAWVTLDYVVTGAEGQANLTPKILVNHREKLIKLAARLRARDFAPGAPSAFKTVAAHTYYGVEGE